MMRSLYAGVSGLQNHQTRTDVIGNNIANINSNGFKKGRVTFHDMLSQTLQGASSPQSTVGGTNPKQVGLGVATASIDTLMYQGSMQSTGKKTDLAIQGEGFFIQKKGEQVYYTRAGNYTVDKEKQLVNPANGFKVQGWNAEQDTEGDYYVNTSKTYEDIIIPIGDKFAAKATSQVAYKSNLDSRVDPVVNPDAPTDIEKRNGSVHMSSIDIYDSQGKVHKVDITFVKIGINQWRAQVDATDAVENSVRFDVEPIGNVTNQLGGIENNTIVLTFDEKGAISAVREGGENNPDLLVNGELRASLVFNVDDGSKQRGGASEGIALGREQKVSITLGSAEGLDGITQLGAESTTKAISQNGYSLGYLSSFRIDQAGGVTGVYTNGQVKDIAKIALATFINPGGLEKAGETTFVMSNNSGIANVSAASTEGKGKILSGALEMSNVDLAEEFTDMIVTQRGFQANSRIITTSDQMLQELLTLKR